MRAMSSSAHVKALLGRANKYVGKGLEMGAYAGTVGGDLLATRLLEQLYAQVRGQVVKKSVARVQGSPPRKKSQAQIKREVDAILAATKTRSAPLRVAYRLQLTPSELRVIRMAAVRYAWPDMLMSRASEGGLVVFTEPEMLQWTDDVDSDAEGDHAPFPLASGELAEKLQSFYDKKI